MENQSVRLWTKDFVLILLINFFIFLNHLMVLSTFPFYIEYLRGTEAVAGLAAAGFSFVAVFFRPFIAWFLDNGRRRLILVLGLLGMALTPLGYISVSLVVSAVILRMIHGVALGCANTASNTMATDLLPRLRFGEGMGYFGTSIALATAGAPVIALALMNRLGFFALFLVSAAVCFLSLILLAFVKTPKLTVTKTPLSVKAMFDGNAVPASLTLFVFLLTFGALESFLAKFAAVSSLPSGGVFFAVMAVFLMVIRMALGKIVDRRGEAFFVYSCNAAMFCAMLLLAFVPNTLTYLLSAVLVGYGFGGIAPALQAVAVCLAPPRRRGAANSTYLCAYDLGFGFGGGIAGWLISAWGYGTMFAALSLANVVSVILYLTWVRRHPSSFSYRKRHGETKQRA